jgi:hypothetical protein
LATNRKVGGTGILEISVQKKKWSLNWRGCPQYERKYVPTIYLTGINNRIFRELKDLNSPHEEMRA